MKITFTVDRQCIRRTDDMTVVGDSVHYLRAQFVLLDDWDRNHIITPIFERGTRVYTPKIMGNGKYLDHDNTCIVPHEALRGEGVLYVSIFDETAGVRITTNREAVQICPSGYTAQVEQSLIPTPTVYDEILRSLGDIRNKIVPPDWLQNDSESPDYIKNRPFYKEQTAVDYVKLYASNMDADLQMGFYGKRIGLAVGQTYSVDIVSDTGETTTVDCECVDCAEDLNLPNDTIPLLGNNDFSIFDGVFLDDEGNPAVANNAVYTTNSHIVSVTIHGVSGIDEVIHKIPNEFLDVDNTFDANSQKPQSGKAIKRVLDYTQNEILNVRIGTDRIADAAVVSNKIADGAVGTTKIQTSAVTVEKIADASISHSKLQEGIVRGKNIEQPILLESIEISTATEVISPRTTASEDAAHPNKRTYFTKMVLFGELVPTEKSKQTLTLFYDRPSDIILNVPVEFSGAYKTEFYFCIELGMNKMVKAECTIVEKNSEMGNDSKYYTTGWIRTNMQYGYLGQMKLKFGDSATQKFESGTSIQVYGVTSK